MLTGKEILRQMDNGSIIIDPFLKENVGPNSVDLRLDNKLLVYTGEPVVQMWDARCKYVSGLEKQADRRGWTRDITTESLYRDRNSLSVDIRGEKAKPIEMAEWRNVLDMMVKPATRELEIPKDGLVLVPGRIYIGSTIEYTETHNLVPGIEGRSSVGRLGIDVHATAGFGDVGFKGTWTLEISVVHPVRVYAGVRICQLYYSTVEGEIDVYTSNKYQGQRGPLASMLWKDFKDGKCS